MLQRQVEAEANSALRTGATVTAAVGLVLAVPIALIGSLTEGNRHMLPPALFSALCGVWAGAIALLARRDLLRGPLATAVLLGFCAVPTYFFALVEAFTDTPALTYFYGPVPLTYFLCVGLTGFLFDTRLARLAGAVAGLAYLATWLQVRASMAELTFPTQAMTVEMTALHIHLFRTALLVSFGFIVGALASSARRLAERTAREHRELDKVNRLFGQYVSDEVRDRLVQQLTDETGERAEVAVLFSDLRGFTTLSEKLPPDELVRRLNAYFDKMVGAIRQSGGRVDKFIGDAVMAVFGGLLPLQSPCASALEAAAAMRRGLQELNSEWAAQGLPPLDNGIGIHFGEVLQGPLGSKDRKEFAVIGDVVNTASRLESSSKELGASVVLSEQVVQQLPPEARARLLDLGEVKLKGKALPLRVWGVRDAAGPVSGG